MPPASVAQWKSSSVLRKRLGVRVPPGALSLFLSDQGFLEGQTTDIVILARFLPVFCLQEAGFGASFGGWRHQMPTFLRICTRDRSEQSAQFSERRANLA